MDPYQILKISPRATREEIRASYRALARRWHPDRFAKGPERDWANEKMSAINKAYRFCLRAAGSSRLHTDSEELEVLRQINDMIANGELIAARKRLMTLSGRGAEWNYLLGTILLKSHEIAKARIYLSIAAHQQPENVRYAEALHCPELNRGTGIINMLKKHFSR